MQELVIDRLDAVTDFVAKRKTVSFRNVPRTFNLKVVIDPEDTITEILEENNEAWVRK